MHKKNNTTAIIVAVIIAVAAIIMAFIVKGLLPDSMYRWKNLIFWGIVVVAGGLGTMFAGRCINGRKR